MAKTYTTIVAGMLFETATKGRVRIEVRPEAGMIRRSFDGKEYLYNGPRKEIMVYILPNGNYLYCDPKTSEVIEFYKCARVRRV